MHSGILDGAINFENVGSLSQHFTPQSKLPIMYNQICTMLGQISLDFQHPNFKFDPQSFSNERK
jgi:hypothetical protein